MAFNLISGKVEGRSWSRGGLETIELASHARQLPWEKIFIGTGITAGIGLLALAATKPNPGRRELRRRDDPRFSHAPWDDRETREIPIQTMRQLVSGKRA